MGKETITFGEKNSFFEKNVNIDNILISDKISSGKKNHKYFIDDSSINVSHLGHFFIGSK